MVISLRIRVKTEQKIKEKVVHKYCSAEHFEQHRQEIRDSAAERVEQFLRKKYEQS